MNRPVTAADILRSEETSDSAVKGKTATDISEKKLNVTYISR